MLSRIAESLFWLGRYVERAEDTARILDVHVLHLLGDPLVGEDAVCRGLLSVMGVAAPDGELDARRVCDVRRGAVVDRLVARGRPPERARDPRSPVRGSVGEPQRHVQRPSP